MKYTFTELNLIFKNYKCKYLVSLVAFLLVSAPLSLMAQQYEFQGGDLQDTQNWQDGDGNNPGNFTSDGQTFTISQGGTANGDWTVAGEGTRLVINTSDDIVWEQDHTVTLDGITVEFTSAAGGDLVAKSNVVVKGGVKWDYERGNAWDWDYREEHAYQSITADEDSYFRVHNIQMRAEAGEIELLSLNGEPTRVIHADNNLRIHASPPGVFRDNGNKFGNGDDVRLRGTADGWELTGTYYHVGWDANSDFEDAVPVFYNLVAKSREAGRVRFNSSEDYAPVINVANNLILDNQNEQIHATTGTMRLYGVEFNVGGNFELIHHRPQGHLDSYTPLEEAQFNVDGDFILRISKEEEDDWANIEWDDGVINVGGNIYVEALSYGSIAFAGDGKLVLLESDGNHSKSVPVNSSGGLTPLDAKSVELSFSYEQLTGTDVAFDLYERITDPDNPAHTFSLSAEGDSDTAENLMFGIVDDQAPLFTFAQTPDGPGGAVSLYDIEWEIGDKDVASESPEELPDRIALEQNYPNPFNPSTVIGFSLPNDAEVTLEVFNVVGQRLAVLLNGYRPAGHHQVTFDAGNLSSGMYIYRLSTDEGKTITRQMIFVK